MSGEAERKIADEGIEDAWALEIERRARRVLAGESTGTDWAEARARLVSSLPKQSPHRRST